MIDPILDQAKATFIQNIREALVNYEATIQDLLDEAVKDHQHEPDPDPDPDPDPGETDWYMPARGTQDFSNREYFYIAQGHEQHLDGVELFGAKSACAFLSDSSMKNFKCYGSDGDAIKWNYGSLWLENGHVHTVGLSPTAHADGIQGRGNGTNLMCRKVYFDMPAWAGDGSQSNACVILQSALGPMGTAEFESCVFRGGNYTFMAGDKKTGNKICDIFIKDSLFIVEEDSPQYGFFALKGGNLTVENSKVAEMLDDGSLNIISNDPKSFNVKAWHFTKFGRNPGQ